MLVLPCFNVYSFETKNSPVKVTSETLQLDYGKNIITYSGNVRAVQGNFSIKCDSMNIFYTNNKNANNVASAPGDGKIKKIDFHKNVVIEKDGKTAEGDSGLFDPMVEKMFLKGNVILKDKKSYLKGETVVYDMTTKIFNITNAIETNSSPAASRVKIVISDEQANESTK